LNLNLNRKLKSKADDLGADRAMILVLSC
jgi:hypothetical protein